MARETCPAMLMITSSPAPDSASSVTSVWRLSCHRPTTLALSRTLVHAVLNVVTGRVGSFGCPFAARKTYPSVNSRNGCSRLALQRLDLDVKEADDRVNWGDFGGTPDA